MDIEIIGKFVILTVLFLGGGFVTYVAFDTANANEKYRAEKKARKKEKKRLKKLAKANAQAVAQPTLQTESPSA